MNQKPDFRGHATRYNILCEDGLTLRQGAFDHMDGCKVPLLWNHGHNNPINTMGYAILHRSPDGMGMDADCYLNDGEYANATRTALKHGDIGSLSIFANRLKKVGRNVVHGVIREVSVVLAGANHDATITEVAHGATLMLDFDSLAHSGCPMGDDERAEFLDQDAENCSAYIFHFATGEDGEEISDIELDPETIEHGSSEEDNMAENANNQSENEEVQDNERTIEDVYNEMTDEQKKVVQFMVGQAAGGVDEGEDDEDENDEENEEEEDMAHSSFSAYEEGQELSHGAVTLDAEDRQAIIAGIETYGSLKASVKHFEMENGLQHDAMHDVYQATEDEYLSHGVTNLDYYFPDAKPIHREPTFIDRRQEWVKKVINGTHHAPMARIKSWHANITGDEARAKGYLKGNRKLEEVIVALKRDTSPQTIYKKQSLDRDDIIDITDFNVVTWLRGEMRGKLDEEVAGAILFGDGRVAGSQDKIDETHIRPIWTDNDVYTVSAVVTHASTDALDKRTRDRLEAMVRARKDYKGTGTPALFTTEDFLTDCLLLKDGIGHYMYETVEKLKTFLRVSDIVTVPIMANKTRTVVTTSGSESRTLVGLLVNLVDYTCGTDKGGAVTMFDDFDIDVNKEKYLIEARMSGALTEPYSAIVVESVEGA